MRKDGKYLLEHVKNSLPDKKLDSIELIFSDGSKAKYVKVGDNEFELTMVIP